MFGWCTRFDLSSVSQRNTDDQADSLTSTCLDLNGYQVRPSRRVSQVLVLAAAAGTLGVVVPSPASASCAGPILGVGSAVDTADPPTTGGLIQRGQAFTVSGEYFHSGCADTYSTGPGCRQSSDGRDDPETPLTNVQLILKQRSMTWLLTTVDATGERHSISWSGRLPTDVEPGPAELLAGSAALPVTIVS